MMFHKYSTKEFLLELYRGIIAEESWISAMDMLSDAFRGSSVFFGALDPGGSNEMVGHRIDPACAALMGGPLATPEANPFVAPMMSRPTGKAITTSEMCGDSALIRSEVFQSALRPHGQRYVLGAMLDRVGRRARTVALTRPAGKEDYTDGEVALLDELLPHLARAAFLRDECGLLKFQSTTAFAALDNVSRGIVILAPHGAIMFANREAGRIFRLADGLGAGPSGLTVSDRRAADRYRSAIKAIGAEVVRSPAKVEVGLAIPRPSGEQAFTLSAVAAPEIFGQPAGSKRVPIMITIVDPSAKVAPPQTLLRQIYGLTATEAKLASALCGTELQQAAKDLGISINTAKTHLQSVFQKVGVSRQSALVRRILVDFGP